jgi:putative transposase
MPVKRPQFVENEIYHITIRGVEQRPIFIDDQDRWRLIFSLYEFNTTEQVTILHKRKTRGKNKKIFKDFGEKQNIKDRDCLVDILAFVFMPNHLHLLLRQIKPSGVSSFMQKIGSGYTVYFNGKHSRVGHLFQGKFKATHIDNNEYLKTVFTYIHTNPISIINPLWKDKGIDNPNTAKKFLEEYRWSSYLDYLGKNNFTSITSRDFFNAVFDNQKTLKKFVDSWIDYKKTL